LIRLGRSLHGLNCLDRSEIIIRLWGCWGYHDDVITLLKRKNNFKYLHFPRSQNSKT